VKNLIVPAVLAVGVAAVIYLVPSAAPPRQLALTWNWIATPDNPASNIVFLIRSTTNLAQAAACWTIVGITTTNRWQFQASLPRAFFRVQASNTVTHLTSD
jgi:hypothetical protein